jgi:hypothetical protein
MTWTEHISKKLGKPYWYDSLTNKSIWIKPAEIKDRLWSKQFSKKWKQFYWYNSVTKESIWIKPEENPAVIKKEKPVEIKKEKPAKVKSNKYSMPIQSNNGMSFTIEGHSHWTNEDYREELCNINEAMRDLYK